MFLRCSLIDWSSRDSVGSNVLVLWVDFSFRGSQGWLASSYSSVQLMVFGATGAEEGQLLQRVWCARYAILVRTLVMQQHEIRILPRGHLDERSALESQVLYSNKTHGTLMSDVDRAAHEFVCLGDLGEDVGEGLLPSARNSSLSLASIPRRLGTSV
ncbi:unnamed protein product [Durusdinium trenchii]|uniref:Uncharacterized protein n=1 Tax=Durusdinium trenchii TaxID=1381693 RepID=A0ABP0QR49_9DINO